VSGAKWITDSSGKVAPLLLAVDLHDLAGCLHRRECLLLQATVVTEAGLDERELFELSNRYGLASEAVPERET
jgi:hypothetical protein